MDKVERLSPTPTAVLSLRRGWTYSLRGMTNIHQFHFRPILVAFPTGFVCRLAEITSSSGYARPPLALSTSCCHSPTAHYGKQPYPFMNVFYMNVLLFEAHVTGSPDPQPKPSWSRWLVPTRGVMLRGYATQVISSHLLHSTAPSTP